MSVRLRIFHRVCLRLAYVIANVRNMLSGFTLPTVMSCLNIHAVPLKHKHYENAFTILSQ